MCICSPIYVCTFQVVQRLTSWSSTTLRLNINDNDNDIENLDWELCDIKCVSLIVGSVYQMSGNI